MFTYIKVNTWRRSDRAGSTLKIILLFGYLR